MTTPADNTPYGIICDAMVDTGKLEEGTEPSGEAIAANMRRLRDLVNYFMTQGIKLWLQSDTAVTLTAGKGGPGNPYTFKPSGNVNMTKPLRVIQGYYLDSNGVTRPLGVMSWDDWIKVGNKTIQGALNSYFVDKQQSEVDVYTWLIPDATAATGTMHVLLQTQATNPVTLTETMNFPPEWRIALHWGLAADISTGQPQAVIDRCEMKAEMYRQALENWDVEDAPTSFAPDQRMAYPTGAFR